MITYNYIETQSTHIKQYPSDRLNRPTTISKYKVVETWYRDLVRTQMIDQQTNVETVRYEQIIRTLISRTVDHTVYMESTYPCDPDELPPTTDLRTTEYLMETYQLDSYLVIIKTNPVDQTSTLTIQTKQLIDGYEKLFTYCLAPPDVKQKTKKSVSRRK